MFFSVDGDGRRGKRKTPTMTASILTVNVDQENNAESWWTALRAAGDKAPRALRLLAGRATSAALSASEVDEVRSFAASLPGWADPAAPNYAPHPVTFGVDHVEDEAE
mgnify:CR=1 FL=1